MNAPLWQRSDLPALLADDLRQPLRGAGREFAPQLTYGRHAGPARKDAPAAAVAVALCWDGGEWSLPLTVRHAQLRRHGGQVSLPGGLVDPGETPCEAACRELHEELGIRPALTWLGELPSQFVYASNAWVTPCVAAIDHAPPWTPQPTEVDRVLRFDLSRLLQDGADPPLVIERGPFRFRAPQFIVEGHSAWGATAVVLGELRGRLRRIAQRLAVTPSPASYPPPMSSFQPPVAELRAVTFDLDGLMFNTEELYQEVGGILLARRGKEFTPELLDMMMGRKSNVALQLMIDYHALDATPEQLAAETAEIFGGILPRKLAPMPGLVDLLAALEAARVPKGIATSSGRAFVERVLGVFRMQPRFDFVLASEDIEHGKPAPDVYLFAAERHGVAPDAMMVLEDSQIGSAAAVAAGTYAVAVPHGRSLTHQFPGVRLTADTLADERIYEALRLARPGGHC